VFYTLPAWFIRRHMDRRPSWQKVSLHGLNIEKYRDERGFEQIAQRLGVEYPRRELGAEWRNPAGSV